MSLILHTEGFTGVPFQRPADLRTGVPTWLLLTAFLQPPDRSRHNAQAEEGGVQRRSPEHSGMTVICSFKKDNFATLLFGR